jgi:transposase
VPRKSIVWLSCQVKSLTREARSPFELTLGNAPLSRRNLDSPETVFSSKNSNSCVRIFRLDAHQSQEPCAGFVLCRAFLRAEVRRPDELYADSAYDSESHRDQLRQRGIEPHLARRNEEHESGLGVYRWVSQRTLGWIHNYRRLRVRIDRTPKMRHAFLKNCGINHLLQNSTTRVLLGALNLWDTESSWRNRPGSRKLRFHEKDGKSRQMAVRHDSDQLAVASGVVFTGETNPKSPWLAPLPKTSTVLPPAPQRSDGAKQRNLLKNSADCRDLHKSGS